MVRVSIEMNNLSTLALGGCKRHLNMIFVTSKWILEPFRARMKSCRLQDVSVN
jgi:hypothetical protein